MGVIPEGRLKQELTDEVITIERDRAKFADQIDGLKSQIKNLKGKDKTKADRLSEVLAMLDGRAGLQPPLPLGKEPPRGGPKKVSVEPLSWSRAGQNLVAVTGIGAYRVEPRRGPGFDVIWATGDKKTTKLGEAPTETKARELAEQDWLVRVADGMLENAGDGKLTGKTKANGAEIDVSPGAKGRKSLPPKKAEA